MSAHPSRPARPRNDEGPTVVLVHGAFADASSWNGVIERLLERGVKVTAPADPLRGIAHDSAYTANLFEQTRGPVLAVGHSYGGAVITNAASQAKNVVLNSALVPLHDPTAPALVDVMMISQPQAVTDVILEALAAVNAPAPAG